MGSPFKLVVVGYSSKITSPSLPDNPFCFLSVGPALRVLRGHLLLGGYLTGGVRVISRVASCGLPSLCWWSSVTWHLLRVASATIRLGVHLRSTVLLLGVHPVRHRVHLRGRIATPATVAASETTTTAPWASVGGLVDTYRPSVELDVVHCCDGFLRIIFVGISHEAKSSAATCISVFDDNSLFYDAVLLKLLSQSTFFRVPGKAANEEFRHDSRKRKREKKKKWCG